MENKRILGFYDYTVVLTYIGMGFAFAGIISSINEHYLNAVICLMFAGICDMFDGTIASTKMRTENEKHFGIQIDSMCDLLSFGVLPAIFVYMFLGKTTVAAVISGAFILAALIRLSFFNVQEFERQKSEAGPREKYLGIPVTSIALLLPLLYLITEKTMPGNRSCFTALLILLGAGFLSGFEIGKPKSFGKILLMIIGVIEAVCIGIFAGVDLI